MARLLSTHVLSFAVRFLQQAFGNIYFVKTNMNQRSSKCLKLFTILSRNRVINTAVLVQKHITE